MATEKAFVTGSEFPACTPGTVRLYSMRFCPYAQRARIVLAYKGIKYETVNIHLSKKPEWFLEDINPLGTVPALQADDKVLFESLIVCDYLDEVYPDNKLTPADPYQRARDNMLVQVFQSKAINNYYKTARTRGEDKETVDALLAGLDRMEAELKRRGTPFYGGDKPMMIDFMLWPHSERIFFVPSMIPTFTIPEDRYPNLKAWEARMLDLPAVKCTVFPPDLYKTFVATYLGDGPVDYDAGLKD